MITLAASIAAIALYLAASLFLLTLLLKKQPTQNPWLFCFATSALIMHGVGNYGQIFTPEGFQFGFYAAASVMFWTINLLVLLSSLKKPLHNLFIFQFPISAIFVALSTFVPDTSEPSKIGLDIASHVILSVMAYSLLAIAALQALMLAFQNYQLKHKHPTGMVRLLPPLQTMEALLFEFLWAGEILLTLSIGSGILFLEDIFAQHLAHKSAFSLIAWLIYGILLWGRHQLGWRGNTAIRWALGGFAALMLAYFGSKLVLELVLTYP